MPATTNKLNHALSARQRKLTKKYGTPTEFARACYAAVPGVISTDEAAKAIEKYNREWRGR